MATEITPRSGAMSLLLSANRVLSRCWAAIQRDRISALLAAVGVGLGLSTTLIYYSVSDAIVDLLLVTVTSCLTLAVFRFVHRSPERGGEPDEFGIYPRRLLRSALQAELARSRRYQRQFALVIVSSDELSRRFDCRSGRRWRAALAGMTRLLQTTRADIDRVFDLGGDRFAVLLPEAGPVGVIGLAKRIRRAARRGSSAIPEPSDVFPFQFGAAFYPGSATTVDGLIRRAKLAVRVAGKKPMRIHLDAAEAPAEPPGETLRLAMPAEVANE